MKMFYFFVFYLIGCVLCQDITEPIDIPLPQPPAVPLSSSSFGTSEVVVNIRAVFSCQDRNYGYFADVDNNCTLFHVCHPTIAANGQQVIYHLNKLCPNNTRFSQNLLVCLPLNDSKLIPCGESVQYYPPTETRLKELPVITVENIQSFPEITQRIEEIVSAQRQQSLPNNGVVSEIQNQNIPLNSSVEQRVEQLVDQPIQVTVPVQTLQVDDVLNRGSTVRTGPNIPFVNLTPTISYVPTINYQIKPNFLAARNDGIQQPISIEQRVSVQNQPQIANIQNIEPFQRTILAQQTVPVQSQPQFNEIRNIPVNQQVFQPVQYSNERVVGQTNKPGNVRVAQPIRTVLLNSAPNTLTRAQQEDTSIQNSYDLQSHSTFIQIPNTEPSLRTVVNTQYVPQPVQFYQRFYVPQVERVYQPVTRQVVQPVVQPVVQRFYRNIKQTPDVTRTESNPKPEVSPKQINSDIVAV